ncbi:MAG: hypothetical protein MN733_37560 [Nitrososphaera sp.]|nr:hypothetical protein [Nitrososphaera sp.]
MAEETRPLNEEELKIAFEGPAILANRCLLTLGNDGVRIAFTEQDRDKQLHFRSAVLLSIPQAISLKNTLTNLLREVEEQIAAVEATAKSAEPAGQDNG